MRNNGPVWCGFAVFLAVVLGAMGWTSRTVLELAEADMASRSLADREEKVRLALWRMDSALAPLIAQESARPYAAYGAFYPAERAYSKMFTELQYGDVLVPSSLLNNNDSSQVMLHFQFDPEGKLTSPQVPMGNERDLAESGQYITWRDVELSCSLLDNLKSHITRNSLVEALDQQPLPLLAQATVTASQFANNADVPQTQGRQPQVENSPDDFFQQNQNDEPQQLANVPSQGPVGQTMRNSIEFQKRVNTYQGKAVKQVVTGKGVWQGQVVEDVARPLWVGDTLVLARRVQVGEKEFIQGCWLNWPKIRQSLLEEIADLLPQASLMPLNGLQPVRTTRCLAALPVQLEPGAVLSSVEPYWSPLRLSLITAWTCVLLAALAVGGLVSGVISLSERRGAFVSAVTHELRTPLTTFRLYTEMLASGMVSDPEKQKTYLDTLQVEAQRLAHLVENVLAYAKIERGRAPTRCENIAVGELLENCRPRLNERANQANLQLAVACPEDLQTLSVRCDVSAVEQILFNLVDNACKYASSSETRELHLECTSHSSHVSFRLRDHGPGISALIRRRLFRPFSKTAQDAAHTAPGVGLGLALSRRLARAMKGELRVEAAKSDGAAFVLTLPQV